MTIPFALVCDLLEQAYLLCLARKDNAQTVHRWFTRHRTLINAHDTSLAALLSTLLPEKRTDRVYCVQEARLEKIIGRALFLGSSRMAELTTFRNPGSGLDLGDCVQRILSITPNASHSEQSQPTLEEVDEVLHSLASKIKWSSPAIRLQKAGLNLKSRANLEDLYRRLSPRDAKWLTRLVLKKYQPLIFESHLIYLACDSDLPFVLKIQDDFTTAVSTIQHARAQLLPNSTSVLKGRKMLKTIKPKLGVKVGRQHWLKARSIKHCVSMCHGLVSVENKVDGEYCQVHVEMKSGSPNIQIFSKSGKDSTEDRRGLIDAIIDSLRLGQSDSSVKTGCILEAELAVYSDRERKILPFHKIRKYVARRGHFIDTDLDSQPYEHLIIVYFDVILLNERSLLNVSHSRRFQTLQSIIQGKCGVAEVVKQQTVDLCQPLGISTLRKSFAQVIIEKGEGLVIKPDEPYIIVDESHGMKSGRCIKLKKEYIGNFGDIGDFAVVGAGYNPVKAKSYNIPNLRWTHFFIGCLNNQEETRRWGITPEFTVVNVVELNSTMLQAVLRYGNPLPVTIAENKVTKLVVPTGLQTSVPLAVAFENPLVFDLKCFSFDRPGNTGFWTMRFPCVTKVHFDREWTDVVTLGELQRMASAEIVAVDLQDSQENLDWIARLEAADPRGIAVDAVSQATATTILSPSPRRSTQSSTNQHTSLSRKTDEPGHAFESASFHQRIRPEYTTVIPPPTSPIPTGKVDAQRKDGKSKRTRTENYENLVLKRTKRPQSSHMTQTLSSLRQTPSQTRLPLETINGNANHTSSGAYTTSQGRSLSNNEIPQAPTFEPSMHEYNATLIFGKGRYSVDENDILHDEASYNRPVEAINSPATQLPVRDTCEYVGSRCLLARSKLYIASSLLAAVDDIAVLLRKHGIKTPPTGIDEWWAHQKRLKRSKKKSRNCHSTVVLLVDTVNRKAETDDLLTRLCIHEPNMRSRRERITVYDWRFLEHVTIFEDDGVEKKYYDGFQDPCRRWYCGLI